MESRFLYFSYALGVLILYYAFVGLSQLQSKSSAAKVISLLKRRPTYYLVSIAKGFVINLMMVRSYHTHVYVMGALFLNKTSWKKGLAILLGAGFSTTLFYLVIVELLHFEWLFAGVVVSILGIIAHFVFRSDLYRLHGKRLFFAGLFLLSFGWINSVHQYLSQDMVVEGVWFWINQNLLWVFVGAWVVGIFSRSSFIAGVMALSILYLDLITFEASLAMFLGGFVGAPLGMMLGYSSVDARGNVMMIALSVLRFLATGISLLWIGPVSQASFLITLSPAELLVLVFFLMQVLLVALYVPFQNIIEQAALSFVRSSPKQFHRFFANMPLLNFEMVNAFILDMSATVKDMMRLMTKPFEEEGRQTMIQVDEKFDEVEQMARQINFYLSKMNLEELDYRESQLETHWFQITYGLKNIASLINRNIMEIASQKKERGYQFQPEAWGRLLECHTLLLENYDRMVDHLALENTDTLKSILRNQKQIHSLKEEIKQQYLQMVRTDDQLSLEGTAAFLSLLSQLQFLSISVSRMAYPTIDRRRR